MAQKIYNAQISAYLNVRVAEQVFRCNDNEFCFLILWEKKDSENEILYL